ncbi:MAG TPA: threonine/serine exporter family protein [Candidatus Eisenbacteria bacterium]|nr:threonine/serine exporter family protein [Candidatus Eisenbacteria bacterium]
MSFGTILVDAVPAALFAGSLGVIFTAPPRYLAATVGCGFAGRLVRDLLVGADMGSGWATLLAAATVGIVAAALVRSRSVPPVVMIAGLLPLGAAGATFDMILGFMKIPNLQGEALRVASVEFVASTAKAFVTYLALSVGISLATVAMRLMNRGENRAA